MEITANGVEVTDKGMIIVNHLCSPYVALEAPNRHALVDLLNKCVELRKARSGIGGFAITMPCGYEQEFANEDDIPSENLPCPCGQGYLIKYKEEPV